MAQPENNDNTPLRGGFLSQNTQSFVCRAGLSSYDKFSWQANRAMCNSIQLKLLQALKHSLTKAAMLMGFCSRNARRSLLFVEKSCGRRIRCAASAAQLKHHVLRIVNGAPVAALALALFAALSRAIVID